MTDGVRGEKTWTRVSISVARLLKNCAHRVPEHLAGAGRLEEGNRVVPPLREGDGSAPNGGGGRSLMENYGAGEEASRRSSIRRRQAATLTKSTAEEAANFWPISEDQIPTNELLLRRASALLFCPLISKISK